MDLNELKELIGQCDLSADQEERANQLLAEAEQSGGLTLEAKNELLKIMNDQMALTVGQHDELVQGVDVLQKFIALAEKQ